MSADSKISKAHKKTVHAVKMRNMGLRRVSVGILKSGIT